VAAVVNAVLVELVDQVDVLLAQGAAVAYGHPAGGGLPALDQLLDGRLDGLRCLHAVRTAGDPGTAQTRVERREGHDNLRLDSR
jgi:hypothetical protein